MRKVSSLIMVFAMAGVASAAATLEWIGPNGTASPWETASNWYDLANGSHPVPTNVDTARLYNALGGYGFTDSNVTVSTTTAICQKLQMKYLTTRLTILTGGKLTTTGSVEMYQGTSGQIDIQSGATLDACTKSNTSTATFKLADDGNGGYTETVNVWGTLNVISVVPANGTSLLEMCNVSPGSGTGTLNIYSTGVVNVDAYTIGSFGTGRIYITVGGVMTIKTDVTSQVNTDIAAGKIAGAGGATVTASYNSGDDKTYVTASSGPPTPPAPPASITYPSGSSTGSYTVNWAASTGATSYQLERSNNGGAIWGQVYSGAGISYGESITNGSYRYRVKATNSYGTSAWTTGTFDCVVNIPPPAIVFSAGDVNGWDFYELDGDVFRNNTVDLNDLNVIVQNWLDVNCSDVNNWCGQADIDGSSGVDLIDYALLAKDWSKNAGGNVLLQTIYGTAQDSAGNITANTYRALSQNKGMMMAFRVPTNTALYQGRFKWRGVKPSSNIRIRLYNVTGKNYLQYNHTGIAKTDPATGGTVLIDTQVAAPNPVPSHPEGSPSYNVTDMTVNFGPLEVTAGEYLIVFDAMGPDNTWGSIIRGGNATEVVDMGLYPDGTSLPKRATVTNSAATGETYYYELSATSDTTYTPKVNLFAFQIRTTIVNHAPVVNAGQNQTVAFPDNDVNLDGTVTDDGYPIPPGAVINLWTKQSGPGEVVFGDANAVDTTATFSDFGTYVLRLTADDGQLSTFSEVTVIYTSNAAPNVNAGSDRTVGILDTTMLDGTVTDDGLPNPPAAVTTLWTKESGPGTVTFGNASAVDTTVTFSATGSYVLRLTVDDGEFESYDEATIEVVEGSLNEAPVVNAGSDQTILIGSIATLDGTVTDDGKPNPPATVTTLWTQESGLGTVTFGNANLVDTTADFSEIGTYVLRLTVSDSQIETYDEVTITVNPFTYEGYDPVAIGGEGGTVAWVTNTSSSGSGSLYAAVSGLTGAPTIIKFAVAGTINTGGEIQINRPNVTIAGETAPAPGITLTGGRMGIDTDNVIIRHIRSRNAPLEGFQIWGGSGIIIDHCSISGSGDGAIDINPSNHVIVSRCLIAECVEVHKAHGTRVSAHHNYYTTNNRRQPRVYEGGPLWDFRNNVVEYWTNSGGNILSSTSVNIINNIFGPPSPGESWDLALVITGITDPNTVYTDGNYCEGKNIDAMGLAVVPNEEPNVVTTDVMADHNVFRDGIRQDCGAMPRDSTDYGYAGPAGP